MGCTTTTNSFRISAANVSWGKKNKTCVSLDTVTLTGGEHFLISSLDTDYYVWIDMDGGSVDPSVAGRTGIEVELTTGYSDADFLAAMISAVEATNAFWVTGKDNSSCACIESRAVGAPLNASADGDTGLDIETSAEGFGGDLGKTQGGVEVAFEVTAQDVNADQNGESLVDKIITGTKATTSFNLIEMTPEKWALIVGKGAGDSYTPSGGTEVVGFGESKNYQSYFKLGGQLTLSPIDTPDGSEDLNFWITLPNIESYNYSGTEVSNAPMSFEALVDPSKRSEINIFAYGDGTQDLRA